MKRRQRFVFALAIAGTSSVGETHNSIPKRDAQWGGNYATEFATSRPPKARCPNRKWIKSIEIEGENARRSDRDRAGGKGGGDGEKETTERTETANEGNS
ncbi:hypothetical protein K0M31_000642 [Melipona bicolor]|uniref:Uncharacterized protein n=1 Tax=Melipona bicolor TaxID=60889 RepID=A0AA40GDZ1_9HYME|nr:hypothetical protein K0M31_000642 [Melipona bicolor]